MRTLVWSTLITLMALTSASVAGERIEFMYDLPQDETESFFPAERTAKQKSLYDDWKLDGVEQASKPSPRDEWKKTADLIFTGTWKELGIVTVPCRTLPTPTYIVDGKFDMRWLCDALWPRTRYELRAGEFSNVEIDDRQELIFGGITLAR